MRAYIGFDDTDVLEGPMGTGKLVRRFEALLPEGCRLWGVVRQQLLVDPRIPYTSHNSSACAVVDVADPALRGELTARAVSHIERESSSGSDPGLCLACEGDVALAVLADLGVACTARIVTAEEAFRAAKGAHLSGHGGTNEGVIGAAAAVGLTFRGWSGRFIELKFTAAFGSPAPFADGSGPAVRAGSPAPWQATGTGAAEGWGGLRDVPEQVRVGALTARGIRVVSLDRDAAVPGEADGVDTGGWLRPRLWGGGAVLPVLPRAEHLWESIGRKRGKKT